MVPSDLPAWLTIREAAEHLRVDQKTIRRYIKQGLVRAERIGPRLIRVDLASLDALGTPLERNEANA